MLRWLTSGLLLRILVALLIVSVGPIFIIRSFTQRSYEATRAEVVTQSQKSLDEKALQGLESRSIALAKNVADFLTERENDLRFLASQTPDAAIYLNFASAQNGNLWTVTSEGTEKHFTMPIYQEIVFVGLDGKEQIKVSNLCKEYPFQCSMVEDGALTDVSRPANTLYRSETYVADSARLKTGEVYIGKPVGFHLPPEVAYASAQYRSGERYRGVLRMTAPVYQDGQRIGTLVLAIEMLHLIEFTAHVAPSNPAPQAEIDARVADFSYMVSPEGWAISQPRHFNIYGVDETGQPVKGINESDLYRPGNLTQMGFIDPAFPELVQRNQKGENGMLWAKPKTEDNKERALIYATIPYFSGQYDTPAGFGLVVLSTDGGALHIDAEVLSKQFDNQLQDLSQLSFQLITATLVVVLILAVLLARTIVSPILRLTNTARIIEAGHWDKVNIPELEKSGGGAEVGQLARVFASMAKQIHARETELRKQVEGLRIVIDEAKRKRSVEEITDSEFFQGLTRRAAEMRQHRDTPSETPSGPDQKQE